MIKEVPKPHFDEIVIILDGGKIIIKDCGYIILRKEISSVADEKWGFSYTAIAK